MAKRKKTTNPPRDLGYLCECVKAAYGKLYDPLPPKTAPPEAKSMSKDIQAFAYWHTAAECFAVIVNKEFRCLHLYDRAGNMVITVAI